MGEPYDRGIATLFPVETFQKTLSKFEAIAKAIELPFHLTGGAIR
jgi:hypothetical protein